ncbi:TIGR02391 family protein [Oxalobacteraceae bacterium R-40]|uniref:TIGR02391 family protein n=1 Tax=Keguizhuia sedimenti TaxID=3064264 RepID=A0ABU1BSW6_9BURK|nr:TIGR02391 family protein [Oxalobacteraceae bacterium R-40]
MKSQRLATADLAGIQYMGLDGITSACLRAITCLINGGTRIKQAALITCTQDHAFLFFEEMDEVIAIKAGFGSGYSGEGSRGLANALELLRRHSIDIEEFQVSAEFMHRLAYSCLLQKDVDFIRTASPLRPSRWYDYIYDQGRDLSDNPHLLTRHYPIAIPFAIIDTRILDLAVAFPLNEDTAIISAFRRLEDIVRKRTGLPGEGTKLFSKAFMQEDSPLKWDVPDEGEFKGRASLFNAIFMAFRNARVHREIYSGSDNELREFLLVNELYRLESEAMTETELEKNKKAKQEEDSIMEYLNQKAK